MTSITEHDGEHERERDNSGQRRVDFAVLDGSIGVDDGLETFGEPVHLEVGRRCLGGLDLVDDGRHGQTSTLVNV